MFFEESIDFLFVTFACLKGVIADFSEAVIVLWSLDCLNDEYRETGEYWVCFIESFFLEYLKVFRENSEFIKGLFP